MPRYSEDSKERVREAVDMVDLVSARVDLRRAGANRHEGLCPFHDERTPSFGIDPVKKVYHCFGCGAGGDVFRYVMETEGLDFQGALSSLADRYGVELEVEDEDPAAAARRQRRERIYALLERTTEYYARYLWEADEARRAREYLAGRGLEEPTLRAFRVGYAPSPWDRVIVASLRAGFSEEEVRAAGLGQRSQKGTLYDRFRGRIMFPLADHRGRIVGFGARAMRDDQRPKYLNTSEGEVYTKGRHLFGANLARADAAKAGSAIVVEGYTDVLALHQAGMTNSVGLMGTALTEAQVDELARLAPQAVLALDADASGQEAMVRAAAAATRRRLELRVVAMPEGSDPADLVQREGPDAMRALVSASVDFARFRVERTLAAGDLRSGEGRDRVLGEVGPVITALAPGALREELTRLVASRLELSDDLTSALLEQPPTAPGGPVAVGPGRPTDGSRARAASGGATALDRREETERRFLAFCVALPEQGREALAGVREEEHFTGDLVRRAVGHLRDRLATPLRDLPDEDPELVSLISELVVRAGTEPASADALRIESLQLEKLRLERKIAAAREAGTLEVGELAAEREAVLRGIREAMG